MNTWITSRAFFEKVIISLFVLLSAWWLILFFVYKHTFPHADLVWAASYQIIAILGAIFGLVIAKQWGGFKSALGRSILLFSTGLLLQSFGQSVFSFYNLFLEIDIPYPSISDIGFFGSILFYIYGALVLGNVFGAKVSLKNTFNRILIVIIPAIILFISYYFFLRAYEFDGVSPLQVFLDFGYPLGQAIYLALAISVFILSSKFLGGVLRSSISFILVALIVQYVADYNFLYQALNGTWVNGDYGDYIYLLSYTVLSLGLIKVGDAFYRTKFSESTKDISEENLALNTPEILTQIILSIIKRQEKVAGQIAWEEAKDVLGKDAVDQQKEEILIKDRSSSNLKKLIDGLVFRYKQLFGDLAIEVSKNAARNLLAELSKEETPESLK